MVKTQYFIRKFVLQFWIFVRYQEGQPSVGEVHIVFSFDLMANKIKVKIQRDCALQ
jgi:hypothetical protein